MLRSIAGVNVLKLYHQPGTFSLINGIKKGDGVPGEKIVCGGNGTYGVSDSAQLTLIGEKDGTGFQTNIAIQVRQQLGRKNITKKLVQELQGTIPATIELEEHENQRGEKYFKISDACCTEWLVNLKGIGRK